MENLSEEEMIRRGHYLAGVFDLQLVQLDTEHAEQYITRWGIKSALGIYRVAKKILEEGE